MNISAEKAGRKWPFVVAGGADAAMVTVAAVLAICVQASPAAARKSDSAPWGFLFDEPRSKLRRARLPTAVPLPKPRPAEADTAAPDTSAAKQEQLPAGANGKPVQPAEQATAPSSESPPSPAESAPVASPPSACRLALTDAIAVAPSIPDIHGPGGCGGEDLVRLEAVVLPDKRQVTLRPAAILRCAMASQVVDWVRTDIAPLAVSLGSEVSGLDNFDSYECRGRNRVAGAKLSEHGRANALDVRAFTLANGQSISLIDKTVPRTVRETVLHSACARFSTVLGPGSDGYHEDHIHLDLMERRNNYKICQWNVLDALPKVAPMLPAERPDDAPPREAATKTDSPSPDVAVQEPAKAGSSGSEPAKSDTGQDAPPIKKRRKPAL